MKARIAIVLAIGTLALVLTAVALAVTPPTANAPANGTRFTSGATITFQGTSTATATPPHLYFDISKDSATNPDGSLTNAFAVVRGDPTSTPTVFDGTAGPADNWPSEPGDYYWQTYQACGTPPAPGDCTNWSTPVVKLTIGPRSPSAASSSNPPNTFLNKHPKHRTHKRKLTFSFKSDVASARFQCLYAQGWSKCTSPHTFRHLKPGRFRFQVKAIV